MCWFCLRSKHGIDNAIEVNEIIVTYCGQQDLP